MAKMSFKAHSKNMYSTSKILTKVNQELEESITTHHYLTAFYIILNIPTGKLTYSKASHPNAIIYRKETNTLECLKTKGMFIGMFKEGNYEEKPTILNSGDKIVLITDGFTDAENPERNKRYGIKRLEDIIKKTGKEPVNKMTKTIVDNLYNFTHKIKQEDDFLLLIIGRD